MKKWPHLVFINFPVLKLCLALLLKGDDDQSDENVDEKEGKDDEEDKVEDGHLCPKQRNRPLVLERRPHGVLENSERCMNNI